jgi:hypothetical protein
LIVAVQLSFAPEALTQDASASPMEPRFNAIHVSASTFKAGLAANIHRWFRLTPSFGPDLVHQMLNGLNTGSQDYILDPFSGAGTTGIECRLEGLDFVGFEINPLLHFVGRVSTNWELEFHVLEHELERICSEFMLTRPLVDFHNLQQHGLRIPPIHNPTRWWRPDVLTDMLVIKRSIMECPLEPVRDFFRLCLAGVLVPDLTNVTLGRLQLHFIDRSRDAIDTLAIFSAHARNMIHDVSAARKLRDTGTARVLLQDSTDLRGLALARPIDRVITSPPYPNRYSYVWNTRPHLYMLDIIEAKNAATEIDRKTIGGTWGSATSDLIKGIIQPIDQRLSGILNPFISEIRERDNLMANYAMHYFNRIAKHLISLDPHLSKTAQVAYVVGNSWLKDVYIETDVVLAKIFEALNLGYSVFDIHRFRRRNSGKDLFESIVYAKKSG